MIITEQILQNEREVRPTDWLYLQEDLDKYPFFLPLRKAYVKSLLLVESENYKDELAKLACTESNRKNLFFYLNNKEVITKAKQEDKIQLEDFKEAIVETKETQPVEENNSGKILDKTRSSRLVSFTQITNEAELNIQNHKVEEKEKPLPKSTSEPLKEEKKEKVTKEEKIVSSTPLTKDKPKSFKDWMMHSNKNTNTDSTEVNIEDSKIDILPIQSNSVLEGKAKVIDEFLSKNYKAKLQKETNKASSSVNKDSETMSHLMTETLAQIYVEQHKYDKAIKAFTILRLKYPKKNDYFANRIKEIRELKNN